MKLRDRILGILEEARGSDVSGEVLAGQLSVSRNAVWKAVRQLQEEGHEITAAPHRGYQLLKGSRRLSTQGIARHLAGLPLCPEVFDSLPSTMSSLQRRAEEGAPEGLLLVTEEQTGGKGRFGRSFYSPKGGGIYMSLLLRPTLEIKDALCITSCAAVAVCRAIEQLCGLEPAIKWVNDVFYAGKKICGIATEASLDMEGGGLHYAVLGIGVNVYPSPEGIPPELAPHVGTLLPEAPDYDLRSALIGAIWQQFWLEYPHLAERRYFADYERRCFVLGQDIEVLQGAVRARARALSLTPDLALRVRFDDGHEELLSSGEVSIRPTAEEGA